MKKTILKHFAFLFLAGLLLNCSTDNNSGPNTPLSQIDFVKTLGGTNNESAQAIAKTLDGGYVILGHTQSMDMDITDKQDESFDFWLLKFNSTDELVWSKTYGGSDDDRGNDVIQTSDGGYAILGHSQSDDGDTTSNEGSQDYWIAKLDASGNISWQKSFGFSGLDFGISLIETNDSGYLISGVLDVTASNGEGNSRQSQHAGGDYWAIKLNNLGNKEWSKFYGGSFTDTPFDILQTNDNNFIIAGSSDSDDVDISGNKGTYDFWIIKIENTGEIIWEKSFGGSEIDEARAIVQSDDNGYVIVGDTRSSDQDISENNGAADLWLIKISSDGNLLWEQTLGGTNFDAGSAISKTQDNGFLLAGNSRSSDGDLNSNNGQNDAWVVKVNSSGQIQWQKSVGGSNIDFVNRVIELNDRSIVAVGESSSSDADIIENKGFTDLLIIKIKQN